MTVPTFWTGELQFRRYSDTSTQGQQIVLALPDREALARFVGMEGKRFMTVLVLLGDDDKPVATDKPKGGFSVGPLCREAIDLCPRNDFWKFIGTVMRCAGPKNEAEAKEWLLEQCGQIASRKELDADPIAGQLFIERVRLPFMRWQKTRSRETA